LQPDPHPRLLGLILQPNSLKLGSCKFNAIINIINIILGSDVAVKPKTLGYSFTERPNTFKSLFFYIFYAKKINPRHRAGYLTSKLNIRGRVVERLVLRSQFHLEASPVI